VYWVDVSQAIGAYATAGALIFVGVQTLLTRKQTRLMQEQVGRAWIGSEKEGISIIYDTDRLAVHCKNYGNVPSKLSNYRAKIHEVILGDNLHDVSNQIKNEIIAKKGSIFFPLREYVFPDNITELTLYFRPYSRQDQPTFQQGREYIVGVVIEYEDAHRIRGDYGFIVHLSRKGEVSIDNEWFG
jgi:hypothetical protein